MATWLVEVGCSGAWATWRMFGGALDAKTTLVAPGVAGAPPRQELPRLLSRDAFTNCIDAPPPLAAMGQGNSDLKSTSSITSLSASRSVRSSPSLFTPPLHAPRAVTP